MEKINHEFYNSMLNSREGAEKSRNKSDEKGYIRLYNLRNKKEKNNLLKTEFLTNINYSNKPAPKRKTIEERDRYLQNLYKEGLNFMEKVESERTNTQKQLFDIMRLNTNAAWTENNKFFLEKIMLIFHSATKHISAQDRNLYEIDEENKFKEEEIINEKSSFDGKELKKFLFDFGFALFDFSQEKEEGAVKLAEGDNENEERANDNVNSNYNASNNNKSKNNKKKYLANKKEKVDLKAEEKKLINSFVNSAFLAYGAAEKISSNDLFLYVIGILNLYDYYIYSSYKKTNPIPSLKKNQLSNESKQNPNKSLKLKKTEEEVALKNQIIKEIKEEISKKATKKTRYASFDSENHLIVTDENANNLKKDFLMFYLNFMFKHNIKNNKETVKFEVEKEFKQNATFKPKIDENSKKLYSDYRRKIIVTDSHKSAAYGPIVNKDKEINEYIDGLILGKKKKEK